MKTPENQHTTMAIMIAAIIVVMALTGWVGRSVWHKTQAQKEEARLERILQEQQHAKQKAQAEKIESVLNQLLADMRIQADAYKKERKLLSELIQPQNLAQPDYRTENLVVMERLVPALRGAMDKMMLAFEKADHDFKAIIEDRSPTSRQLLSQEWQEMTQVHIQTYVDFFALEEELINAHLVLMKFYTDYNDDITYDAEKEQLIFTNQKTANQHKALREEIKSLYRAQAESLTKPPADSTASHNN